MSECDGLRDTDLKQTILIINSVSFYETRDHVKKHLSLDCNRYMSITIQFLISFLRSRIPGFDGRANLFRKRIPNNPEKNSFCIEIWNVCKNHAKSENDQIEFEEGQNSKNEHSKNFRNCCSRISSK